MSARVIAIALLALRAAIRSRMVVVLLLLLAGAVLGLPRVLRGDGTPAGDFAILLETTQSACFGLLALTSLWAGCAALAAERDSRLLDLTRVKPVHGLELWLGKWLGLLVLQALALLAVAAGMSLQVAWHPRARNGAFAPFLVCRQVARPELPSPADEARRECERALAEGEVPPDMTTRQFYREQLRLAQNRYEAINPGETRIWRISMPVPLRPGDPLTARFKFDVEWGARGDVRGVCRLRAAGSSDWLAESPIEDFTMNTLAVPLASAAPGGCERFELAFEHTGPAGSAALLINPRRNVAVLAPWGSFAGNLARAMCIQWAWLALLAALGVTLGCAFSFPVAAFCAVALLMFARVSMALARDPPVAEPTDTLWARGSRMLVVGVIAALEPVMAQEPFTRLASGERIDWKESAQALAVAGLAGPAILAVIGACALRRREALC